MIDLTRFTSRKHKIQTWWSLRTDLYRRYQTVGPDRAHRRSDSCSRHTANSSGTDADLKAALKAPRIQRGARISQA